MDFEDYKSRLGKKSNVMDLRHLSGMKILGRLLENRLKALDVFGGPL